MNNKRLTLKVNLNRIVIFFLLLYGYTRSFFHYSILKSIAVLGIEVVALYFLLRLAKEFKRLKIIDILLLITCIVPLASLIGKDYSGAQFAETRSWTIMYVAAVLLIITEKDNLNFCHAAIQVVDKFSLFYVFFTYLFFLVPPLFTKYAINLLSPDRRESVLRTFRNGNMPGLTAHYSTNGIYLSVACLFFFGILFYKVQNKTVKKIDYFKMFLYLGALGLTGKRAPFIMTLFGMFIVFYMYYSDKPRTRFKKIILYSFIGLFLMLIIATVFPSLLNSLSRLKTYFVDSGEDFSAGRNVLYAYAISMFYRNPITGCGWASFRKESVVIASKIGQANNGTSLQAHNVFLQLLAESGIIGTLITLVPMVYILVATIRLFLICKKKSKSTMNGMLHLMSISMGFQVFFWLYCLTGNPFYDSTCMYIYVLSACFYFNVKKQMELIADF